MANSGDDYSLSRVPMDARRPMWEVLVIRIGSLACVSQLMLGASLGFGMTFWGAFWATMCGSVLLQVVSWAIGAAAANEGLSTSLLSRWSGFGKMGSAIIGGVIAVSLMGWFGVQNSVFAEGLYKATGIFNTPIWAIITGMGITVIVVFGFKVLSATADIFVPLFIAAVLFAAYHMLSGQNLGSLIHSAAPGPALSFGVATTMVAGGFMIGAVTTPDTSRFLKNGKEVFWMTLIGTFVGELGMNLIAVLMAHAVGTSNVVDIMLSLTGWLGAAIVIFSTIKLNDINLYSSSLGITTMLNALFNVKISRTKATWVIGIIGTFLSMIGIINYFQSFLTLLGVAIPPVAGIIVIDYYVLKRNRQELNQTRAMEKLPQECEKWNPITIISWIVSFLVGYFVKDFGIPAINSLLTAAILYFVCMKAYGAYTKQENVQFAKTDQIL